MGFDGVGWCKIGKKVNILKIFLIFFIFRKKKIIKCMVKILIRLFIKIVKFIVFRL